MATIPPLGAIASGLAGIALRCRCGKEAVDPAFEYGFEKALRELGALVGVVDAFVSSLRLLLVGFLSTYNV